MARNYLFGTVGGAEVTAYVLENEFLKATILSMGATLQSLVVKEQGVDVALGYETPNEYLEKGGTIGALCGRFANRIRGGKLTVDGVEYALYCNDRGNHLHGGKVGYDKRIFTVAEHTDTVLKLSIFSPDGEENYPGNLQLTVTYSLVGSALKIRYEAVSDKATAINLTNHAYFNLNGAGTGSALEHSLKIDANYYLSTDETMIPDGKLTPVENTPFDFRTLKTVKSGDDLLPQNADLQKGAGFDHCFVFESSRDKSQPIAELCGDKTGIKMLCYTDLPSVQLYAGNFLDVDGKGGHYGRCGGLCLETQAIPDNVNQPIYAAYGSSIYGAGEEYVSETVYEFSKK
jgi:aldose 1-epimerase